MSKTCIGGRLKLADGTPVPTSKGFRSEDTIYVSGQLKFDGEGDITEQTSHCLESIRGILEEGGMSMQDIIKCTVWITDAKNFSAYNDAYGKFFPENPPARTTLVSQLVVPGALVEIEAIAQKA